MKTDDLTPWKEKKNSGLSADVACREMIDSEIDLFTRLRLLRGIYDLSLEDAKRVDMRASDHDESQRALVEELDAVAEAETIAKAAKSVKKRPT